MERAGHERLFHHYGRVSAGTAMIEFSLAGRVCLVTGGTSGLGRTVAEELGALGVRLVIGSSNPRKVEEACRFLGESGTEVVGVTLDVRQPESVEGAVQRALDEFGRLDGLVNAAGLTTREPAMAVTPERVA